MPTHRFNLLVALYLLASMSLSPTLVADDGDYSAEIQIAPTGRDYPFGNTPQADVDAIVYERMYEIAMADFEPRIGVRNVYSNLFTYSDDFSNAAWTKTALTISTNVATPPWAVSASADKLAETSANSSHEMHRSIALTNQAYCFWGEFSAAERSQVTLFLQDSANAAAGVNFDLAAGAVLSTGTGWPFGTLASTAGIQDIGGGWYRCYISVVPAAGTAIVLSGPTVGDSFLGYAGTTGSGILCAQMQIHAGTVPTARVITGATAISYSAPDVDEEDEEAFLVAESKPTVLDGGVFQFTRTFARIPADQVMPGSRLFSRPSLDGTKSGAAYAVGFLPGRDHVFTSARKAVTRVSSNAAATISAAMPSSDIVFVDSGGHTANVPANSNKAAAEAALASLTSLTGIAVTVSTGSLSMVWTGTMTSITVPSGVRLLGSGSYWAGFGSTGTSTTPAITNFEAASHGGVVGDRMAMWAGDALVGKGIVVAVPNSNSVSVMTSDLASADSQVTHVAFSSDADLCYANGPKMCDVRKTTRFYLPGYTTGITTDADIPKQTPDIDPVRWLAAIIGGTTWPVYEVSEVTQYKGAILQQETITLQLSDVLDAVTP